MRSADGFGSAAFLLDSYGGAINRRPAGRDGVRAPRRALLGAVPRLLVRPRAREPRDRWIRGFYAAMRPYVSGFAYQNYIDPDLDDWQHAYYGANYARLQSIKTAVDPDRLFRFRQGIEPR